MHYNVYIRMDGAYEELLEIGHVEFLRKLSKLENVELKLLCNSITYFSNIKEWYIALQCILLLSLRKINVAVYTNNIREAFKNLCKYAKVNKQFNKNVVVLTGYLAQFNIGYEISKTIPFNKICIIINVLHLLTEEQIKDLLLSQYDTKETFKNVKLLTKSLIHEPPSRGKLVAPVDMELKFSQKEYIFLNEVRVEYSQKMKFKTNVPFENFILYCARTYKSKYKKINLEQIFSDMKPDAILQEFAKVYPDITVIAQYPYIR